MTVKPTLTPPEDLVRLKRIEIAIEAAGLAVGLFVLLLLGFAIATRGTHETATFYASTVQANPGSVTGTVDRLQASDDVRVELAEADVTALLDQIRWLRPNGDAGPNAWAQSASCTSEFFCVDDDPVHDGNTTIITSAGVGTDQSDHSLSNWPGPTDVTIDSVTVFSWARKNSSAAAGYSTYLQDPTVCSTLAPAITEAFANYSLAYATACSGGPWTAAVIDSIEQVHVSTRGGGQAISTITAAGIVAQFDDRDFQVLAYVNFTGVAGQNPQLTYEGSESLGEALALQVDRGGGTWTSIVDPFLTGSEATNQIALVNGQDVRGGNANFRIVDSVTNDETGESFLLDAFYLTTAEDHPPLGDTTGLLQVRCASGFLGLRCEASLDPRVPDYYRITGTRWFANGEDLGAGSGGSRSHGKDVPAPGLPTATVNVTVTAALNSGDVLLASGRFTADNTWLILPVLLGIVALVVVGILRWAVRQERRSRQEAERDKWHRDYTFWGKVFK